MVTMPIYIEKNQEFAKGFGAGWGFNYFYQYNELRPRLTRVSL
jgi:hypothetical protein